MSAFTTILLCLFLFGLLLLNSVRKVHLLNSVSSYDATLRRWLFANRLRRTRLKTLGSDTLFQVGMRRSWTELGSFDLYEAYISSAFYAFDGSQTPHLIPASRWSGDYLKSRSVQESIGQSIGEYLATLSAEQRERVSHIALERTYHSYSILGSRSIVLFELPNVDILDRWLSNEGFFLRHENRK